MADLIPRAERTGFATRPPDPTRSKWHRVSYDDTVCGRWVWNDWVTTPASEVDDKDLCRSCWGLNVHGVPR